jgi:hypothetical protein
MRPCAALPIVTKRLDCPKVGIRIIRVAHEAADLKVLAVSAACLMRWSTEGDHGYSQTTPRASQPDLTQMSQLAELTLTRRSTGRARSSDHPSSRQ